MAEFSSGHVSSRATIPGALWRRRSLALVILAVCTLGGIAFSQLRDTRFQAIARIVVEDPTRNNANVLTAAISPDRYVEDQVAIFDLQILAQLASDIVNDTLAGEANKRAAATTVIGVAGNVTLGAGGAVQVGPPGADLSLRADGAIGSGPAAGLRIDAQGEVRRADGTQLIAADGRPLTVKPDEVVAVRSDGLAVLLRSGERPTVVAPGGDVIEDVGRAGVAGLSSDAGGTIRIRYGRQTLELEPGAGPRLRGIDDQPVTRPDNGQPIGAGATRLLLDGSGDGTGVLAGGDTTLVVDANGAVVVAGTDGTVIAQSPNAVVGDRRGPSGLENVRMDPLTFARSLGVSAKTGTNLIKVTFSSNQPDLARIGANAAVDAYRKLRQSNSAGNNAEAVARADSSIAALTLQLAADEKELLEAKGTPARADLADQYHSIIDRLAVAGRELLTDTSGTGTAPQRIRNLQLQLDTIRGIEASDNAQPHIAEIIRRRDLTSARLAQVQTQRDSLLIDPERAASGVTLFSPAPPAEPVGGLGPARLGLAGLIAGAFVAAFVTYVLESGRSGLEDADQVAALLGAPLLGEIPDYRHERLKGDLPVQTDPLTFAAEAYRIVAAALALDTTHKATLVGVVSAGVAQGKTSVTANVAVALAQGHRAVLAVDADFDGRALTLVLGRLLPRAQSWVGVSDMLSNDLGLDDVAIDIPVDSEGVLELLGGGTQLHLARRLFDTDRADELFSQARDKFDTVLVDLPPLLNVAYSAKALDGLDGALVVVPRGLHQAELRQLSDRLRLIGTPVIGFVMTRMALHSERTASLAAVDYKLGMQSSNRPMWSRRRRRLRSM